MQFYILSSIFFDVSLPCRRFSWSHRLAATSCMSPPTLWSRSFCCSYPGWHHHHHHHRHHHHHLAGSIIITIMIIIILIIINKNTFDGNNSDSYLSSSSSSEPATLSLLRRSFGARGLLVSYIFVDVNEYYS